MRRKTSANDVWLQICRNCQCNYEDFYGVQIPVWKGTLPFIKKCDNQVDQFTLALLTQDREAILELHGTVKLGSKIRNKIDEMLERNREVLLSLNPFILADKYNFLSSYLNELALDIRVQDSLLSLDDYELYILERIVNYASEYGINSNNYISNIILNIGSSSIPAQNNPKLLDRFDAFFKLIKDYEKENKFDNNMIGNIGYMLKTGIMPKDILSIININKYLIDSITNEINSSEMSLDDLKNEVLFIVFGMNLKNAKFFAQRFDIDGISSELLNDQGIVELLALKMVVECSDISKLKEIIMMIFADEKFKVNLFSGCILEENLLLFYAKELNKCHPNFNKLDVINEIDGIKLYDAGTDFSAIVKTLGAFSEDGLGEKNYYEEWNDDRYRSRINAVSLIRNDNLAFAEQDGKMHVKLGFFNFDEKMFLGGGAKDINSTPESRQMKIKINSNLCLPYKFINKTREWHNELDYERKNNSYKDNKFKKNPDFIILDQECEDISKLLPQEQQLFMEYKKNTLKAAKEFGNLDILVINREKIAKNEINLIRQMLDEYHINQDINILLNVVTKFNNNRNGCRGEQHRYIRENYFSNQYFQEILNEIDSMILDSQRDQFYDFVKLEYETMKQCLYDKTTINLPIQAKNYAKRGA